LSNNFAYVVMLSAANDIIKTQEGGGSMDGTTLPHSALSLSGIGTTANHTAAIAGQCIVCVIND
jgi:hypothetical protein